MTTLPPSRPPWRPVPSIPATLIWGEEPRLSGRHPHLCRYLRRDRGRPAAREVLHVFGSDTEARLAYDEGELELHVPILVRRSAEVDGQTHYKLVRTTVGRLIFNEGIPRIWALWTAPIPSRLFEPEINFVTGKKQLGKIIDKCIVKPRLHRVRRCAGHHQGQGLQVLHPRLPHRVHLRQTIPEKKYGLIENTEKEIVKIERQYKRGFLTNDERYRLVVEAWEKTTKDVTDALMAGLDATTPSG